MELKGGKGMKRVISFLPRKRWNVPMVGNGACTVSDTGNGDAGGMRCEGEG